MHIHVCVHVCTCVCVCIYVCVCVCSGAQETPADEETGQATGTGRELRFPGQMRLLHCTVSLCIL